MIISILREKIYNYIKDLVKDKKGLSNLAVEEPKNEEFGDLSTNASMLLAPLLKENPLEIAEKLKREVISRFKQVENASIAKPGFINFNLKDSFIKEALNEIIEKEEKYGFNDSGRGSSIQLEYVSSNPTGSLHIGHGRWGALGDSLANIYDACGYNVSREYYVNDYGTQAEKFSECAECIYLKHFGGSASYPEEGYPEKTVSAAVKRLIDNEKDRFIIVKNGRKEVDREPFRKEIIRTMVLHICRTLELMGVEYDRWFYESSLFENSNFQNVLTDLESRDLIYKKDGAVWFRTSLYTDDEDRVVIRKDGSPSYFASDILYLLNKVKRGYDRLFYILGADHHGYVDRLKAAGRALGLEEDKIVVIIGQLVRIVDKGQALKMSRRKGQLYNLRDLIEEVGKDAVRYFFSMSSFDTPMDFDIGLAKQKSNQNPVFYVQYAHARIESIIKKIEETGRRNGDLKGFSAVNFLSDRVDTSKLVFKSKSERNLAKIMILYPDAVYAACRNNAPHLVTGYLYRLAAEFHYFYNNFRVIDEAGDNAEVDMDRFTLIMLARQVLRNALKLLNVSAPEKM